jgi:hypothetical protein
MNFTKKNKIIMGVTAGVIAIAVIVTAILLTGGNTTPPVIDDPNTSKPSSDVVVNLPTDDPSCTEKENDDALVIDVGGNPENPTGTGNNSSNSDHPLKTPEKPVETKKPNQPVNSDGGGIQIGDDHDHTPYSCGTANHKCSSPESHAFIANLEIAGCEYCGSHSCPSFYGTDEWGNSGLFPKLCPKYDIKKDPLYYCQDCDKKVGDGTNGTCVQFINACKCPLCGADVPARTCHSCK